MKILRAILTFVQIVIIVLWVVICSTFGMVLMLITWNPSFVQMFVTRWIWSPIILLVSGVRVRLHRSENIDYDHARIYVSNHASQYDIVALCRVMPITLFYFVKKELKSVPFAGWYIYALGHIFVDRKNKESAKQSIREAANKVKNGKNVISFAEGTRTKTGELQVFRRGPFIIAKEGDIDIVPVAIQGSYHVLPSGSFTPRAGVINIYIGSAISADEYRNMTVEELASHTRQRVQDMLDSSSVV